MLEGFVLAELQKVEAGLWALLCEQVDHQITMTGLQQYCHSQVGLRDKVVLCCGFATIGAFWAP